MKRKQSIYLGIMIVTLVSLYSCDRRTSDPPPEPTPEVINPQTSREDEAIYQYQSTITNVIGALVRYSETEKAYYLDLSADDAKSIGFTDEEYNNALKFVVMLNNNTTEK